MHDANPSISAEPRRSGCLWLFIALLAITAVVVVIADYFAAEIRRLYMMDRRAMKDLKISIPIYRVDYNRFPILGDIPMDRDLALRSRGPMLPALIGKDASRLNPMQIKFMDLPMAKNRKSGLWQDGEEWVLSNQWGEPFYIILDTNGDGKIANPEYGADQSDPTYAMRCKISPPPPEIPVTVIIYSSGPDRDPKTWNDNVCSWR